MKRHAASRQKPVPKLASMPWLGPSFPVIPSFTEGANFTVVMGTTTAPKSRACSTVEERGIAGRLGKIAWAAALGGRQQDVMKLGMTSRKITNYSSCLR